MNKTLPTRLSTTIRVALKDLTKVEASKKYKVYMGDWHSPDEEQGICEVCFAGAVMAKTLGCHPTKHQEPQNFEEDVMNKLFAVDRVRVGDIQRAVHTFYGWDKNDRFLYHYKLAKLWPAGLKRNVRVPVYNAKSPERFHTAMRLIADTLGDYGY